MDHRRHGHLRSVCDGWGGGGSNPPAPTIPSPSTIRRIPAPTPLIVQAATYHPTANAYVIIANKDSPLILDTAAYLYAYNGDSGLATATAVKVDLKGQERGAALVSSSSSLYAVFSTNTLGDVGGDTGIISFDVNKWSRQWTAILPRFSATTINSPVAAVADASGSLYITSTVGIPTPNDFVAYFTRTYKLLSNGTVAWSKDAGNPPPAPDSTLTPNAIAVSSTLGLVAVVSDGSIAASYPSLTFPDGRPGLSVAFSATGSNLFVSTYLSTYTLSVSASIIATASLGGFKVVPVPGTGSTTDWNIRSGRVSGSAVAWTKDYDSGSTDIQMDGAADSTGFYVTIQGTRNNRPVTTVAKYSAAGAITWVGTDANADSASVSALNPAKNYIYATSIKGITNIFV
ncbi:hypothetical protein BC829DRAFT_399436 [Chytridium lagenaria]|nr:hypothetical protein BC829DRAFT_399436 [Chytridium lagenaria]